MPLTFRKPKKALPPAWTGHIHEQLQILVNMAILRTKVNPIMENKTRNFEQKLAKIAKPIRQAQGRAGAANTPLPHDNYWNSTPSYLRRRQNHFFLRGLRVLLFKIFSSPCRTKE
jgi:hypothetical protein